jgi:hypothetical protein
VFAASALVLAGCGGDSDDSAEPAGDVEEQLGFDDEGIQERERQVEEHIRDCMEAQGFEYVPVDPAARQAQLVGSADLPEEEFIEQFGYGISTLYEERQARVGDPNARIREQLSPTDRAAYDVALRGQNADATFFLAMDTGDFTELGGCTREATIEVFGGADTLQTLIEKLDELDEQINADSRMVAAFQKWSECMQQEGFSFGTNPDDIDLYIEDKLAEIVGDGTSTTDGAGTSASAASDGSEPSPPATYDAEALASLQREELQIAQADFRCEEEVIAPVEEEVRPEYEEAFRAQNGALIEESSL